ncbi:MAG: M16 family peptidase [Parcubacteria group bacterium Gr01-1014_73]|nr:MAG: M16 family peptidase [Parcubacteria group bacterium Gr01-1014_73]
MITVPMKDNPTATVLVLVEAGSKYETKANNGVSHFLEHMCFKGTKKRPTPLAISHELDSIGAHYNAFTAQEFTGYFAKGQAGARAQLLNIVSDIYLNSTLPAEALEKERGVIIEEINMYEDIPQRQVADEFMALLYGGQPAGFSIAGTKEHIKALKREDFLAYRKAHYLAQATTVVVAGNIDEEKVKEEVAAVFKNSPAGKKAAKLTVIEKQKKPALAIKEKKTDQTHFILGVRSFGLFDKREILLRLLAEVLGGGMSSRLFQKLREEMGVCYYVKADNEAFTDHGIFGVAVGVDRSRLTEVVKAVLAEFEKLKKTLVVATELAKAKAHLTGSMFLSLESSDALAEYYGFQEIFKKEIKKPAEIAEKILAVTAADLKKIAGEIFVENQLNLAVIGQDANRTELEKTLRLAF